MRFLLSSLTLLFTTSVYSFDHSSFDALLSRHVDAKGMVDYVGLQKSRASLDKYLKNTGAVNESTFRSWSEDEQLAFLINIYNAETLQLILDNYPVSSIKKIGGFLSNPWKRDVVALFGDEISLDKLEHGIIRKDYDEPRIHFAVVCAANGCPPLRPGAYTGAGLDSQLNEQTKQFLTDLPKNRIDGDTLYLSPIFDWYGEDFTKNGRSLNDYVDPYMKGDASGKKVRFTDYDWDLNKQ
jgi:hypothetical protein